MPRPTTPDAATLRAVLADLVAIPSYESEHDVQTRIADMLSDCGFDCRLDEIEPGRPNLVASRGGGGPLVCSHADTQLPFAQPDPFRLAERDGVLRARGALDAKGQIAALVLAARLTDAPAGVLITCDEEFGGTGSQWAVLPDGPDPAAGGIVLEPTAFRVCVAEAGNVEFELEASGRPVHVAEPEHGLSALDVLGDALHALDRCAFLRATHPLLPRAWRHTGRLEAGEHLWRVPASARAEVSLAVLPGTPATAARDQAVAVLQACGAAARDRGGSLRFTERDVNEPFEVPAGLPVVQRLRAAIGDGARLGGMRSWTDASHLLHLHGLPCVVFGAGELASAHSDDEHVAAAGLLRLASVLADVLRGWDQPLV